jgi:hypothetical protein
MGWRYGEQEGREKGREQEGVEGGRRNKRKRYRGSTGEL